MIQLKNEEQFALMREAGLIVQRTLETLRGEVADGISTARLGVICASVNQEIVHGIPGGRVLRDGDVVSIDCGAIYQGWHGDSAITVGCGTIDPAHEDLLRVTEQSMWHGIAAIKDGRRVSDIGEAIQGYVRSQGPFGIVEGYGGHGIGTEMHMDPFVHNHRTTGGLRSPKMRVGMALAIEPMLTLGTKFTMETDDGWTVVSRDGSPAAHFEHTVCLTERGLWVTTAADGGKAGLEPFGVAVHP